MLLSKYCIYLLTTVYVYFAYIKVSNLVNKIYSLQRHYATKKP